MGLDVMLVSKDKGENQVFYSNLSRSFCNFLCGPDAYENSEFDQIQQLTGLDLSLFKSYPVNLEPNVDELEYKLYLAEEENDSAKIEELQNKIEKTKIEWEQTYDSISEGWIKVENLTNLTQKLISALEENQKINQKIEFNLNWGSYFDYKVRKSKEDLSYIENTLIEDLNSLLLGLEKMRKKGITFVTFRYG